MADKIIDWGDGTQIIVKTPNLSNLKSTRCPVDCFPEGEEGTGKVVCPPVPDKENSQNLKKSD